MGVVVDAAGAMSPGGRVGPKKGWRRGRGEGVGGVLVVVDDVDVKGGAAGGSTLAGGGDGGRWRERRWSWGGGIVRRLGGGRRGCCRRRRIGRKGERRFGSWLGWVGERREGGGGCVWSGGGAHRAVRRTVSGKEPLRPTSIQFTVRGASLLSSVSSSSRGAAPSMLLPLFAMRLAKVSRR